jgi:hypothetical protein
VAVGPQLLQRARQDPLARPVAGPIRDALTISMVYVTSNQNRCRIPKICDDNHSRFNGRFDFEGETYMSIK